MNITAFSRLRRAPKWIMKRFASKAVILMYHRVADAAKEVDPWLLCVSPKHFAEQLEVLRKHAHPVSLNQLVQKHKENDIPDRAVAITFDDGYANNLYNAKPLLEQYNIPATVFVPSGHIGNEREFWWDELERIFLQPGRLPETLTLSINGKIFKSKLGKNTDYSEDENHKNSSCIVNCQENTGRHNALYLKLHRLIQPLLEDKQLKVMDDLLEWAGTRPVRRQTHRTVSQEELLELIKGGLIEVGAHTVTHPFFQALPESLQLDEVRRGKTVLEESIGQQVRNFAYPYGNYTTEAVAIVREAGFDCACTTVDDNVWRGSDLMQLPRVTSEDWDGEEFAKQLTRMFNSCKY